MRSLRSLTRPKCEAYERTYCTPRPISGGFVGRSATSAGSTAVCEMRSPAASALALPEGPPRRADGADPLSSGRPRSMGSPRKRRPTARPERKRRCLGLSGNRLGFRSQWMDSRSARHSLRNGASACVHRCERRQAVRPASIACTARASTPQCATLPGADHCSDLGCSREGAANT